MNFWPFKKAELSREEYLQTKCPPQQLEMRKCVCMVCINNSKCRTERLLSSTKTCGNQWISYCSSRNNKGDDGFDAIFGEFFLNLEKRIVENA